MDNNCTSTAQTFQSGLGGGGGGGVLTTTSVPPCYAGNPQPPPLKSHTLSYHIPFTTELQSLLAFTACDCNMIEIIYNNRGDK